MVEVRAGSLRALRVLWSFRQKVLEGVNQDVRHRYAGSLLGLGWSVLFPVVQIAIYAVVYVFIFRVRPAGMSQEQYILMVFSGLIPLMAFNESLNAGAASLSSNRNLLTSTVFPPELIPVRALLAAQVPSLLGFLLVAAFTLLTGVATPAAIALVPLVWLSMTLFGVGLSWILSLLSLIARDIQQVLPLVMMGLMILSPFAYTPEMVPPALKPILYLNPLSYFVFCFQDLLSFGRLPHWGNFAAALVLGLSTFMLGFFFFRRAKHIFFDYA
jgi:lipopolysaccharide transport system permease protein